MKLDTKKLRKLATDATQEGPWSVKHSRSQAQDVYTVLDRYGMWVADVGPAPKDAAFIAACSPGAILTLLDRLRVCEEQNVALGDANTLTIERDAYRSMLCDVIASAVPNERDHPAMSKAWKSARELLKNGPIPTEHDWLACPDCRALSKSGHEPPRCDVFMANERAAKEQG